MYVAVCAPERGLVIRSSSCHPERSEGSHGYATNSEIPRYARDDKSQNNVLYRSTHRGLN